MSLSRVYDRVMIRQHPRTPLISVWGDRSPLTRPTTLVVLGGVILALLIIRLVTLPSWPVPFSADEAQYFVWSGDLQAGYYSKPPMIAAAIKAALSLCGEGFGVDPSVLPSIEGCSRMLQPAAVGLASVLVGTTAALLTGSMAAAVWAATLFATLPLIGFYSLAATTDAWLLLFWSAATTALTLARRTTTGGDLRLGWWLSVGLFVGLGLLTKYSMALFAVSVLIIILHDRQLLHPGPWLAGLAATLIFLPNLLWNVQNDFPTVQHHVEMLGDSGRSAAGLSALGSFLGGQWVVFGPFLMTLFVVEAVRAVVAQTRRSVPLLFSAPDTDSRRFALNLAWPILLVVSVQAFSSGANTNWAAPAAVGLSLIGALVWVPTGRAGERHQRWGQLSLYGSIVIGIVFGLAVLFMPYLLPRLGLADSRNTNPILHLQGPREAAVILKSSGLDDRLMSPDRQLLAGLNAYLPGAAIRSFKPTGIIQSHWDLQAPFHAADTPAGAWLLIQAAQQVPSTREAHLAQVTAIATAMPIALESVLPLELTHPDIAEQLRSIQYEGRPGNGLVGTWVSRGE